MANRPSVLCADFDTSFTGSIRANVQDFDLAVDAPYADVVLESLRRRSRDQYKFVQVGFGDALREDGLVEDVNYHFPNVPVLAILPQRVDSRQAEFSTRVQPLLNQKNRLDRKKLTGFLIRGPDLFDYLPRVYRELAASSDGRSATLDHYVTEVTFAWHP